MKSMLFEFLKLLYKIISLVYGLIKDVIGLWGILYLLPRIIMILFIRDEKTINERILQIYVDSLDIIRTSLEWVVINWVNVALLFSLSALILIVSAVGLLLIKVLDVHLLKS